jgi:hypothetical protein
MEPSVDRFLNEFNKHVDEPDCGAHLYAEGCAKATAPIATTAQAATAPTGGQP